MAQPNANPSASARKTADTMATAACRLFCMCNRAAQTRSEVRFTNGARLSDESDVVVRTGRRPGAYTLRDIGALPHPRRNAPRADRARGLPARLDVPHRESAVPTRHTLNSSHSQISYAVFCLKKKKQPHT